MEVAEREELVLTLTGTHEDNDGDGSNTHKDHDGSVLKKRQRECYADVQLIPGNLLLTGEGEAKVQFKPFAENR